MQKEGKLLLEYYGNSTKATHLQDVRSVTKSIVSLLVGKAIEEQYISNLDAPISDYLTQQVSYIDSVTKPVTLKHLLTMTAGFDYQEQKDLFPLFQSKNPSSFLLTKQVVRTPGSRFNYNSAAANLMANVLEKAIDHSLEEYTKKALFNPLMITRFHWLKGQDEKVLGGYGLHLTPKELIKIGNLFYNHGKVDGQQVVDEAWLTQITQQHTFIKKEKWGAIANLGYGYYWWTGSIEGEDVFFALGYGGQYLMLVPSLKLILISTATYTNDGSAADQTERMISELFATIIKQEKKIQEND